MATETDDGLLGGGQGAPEERPARRRRSGGRRAAQRRRRRRRQLWWGLTALAGVALAVVALVLWEPWAGPSEPAPSPSPTPDASDEVELDPQPTLVLATYDEADRSAGASQVTVVGWDRETGEGTMLLVPATTVADIPGHGLLPLGRAYGFGEGPLLDATVDNLLGVDLDAVVGVSRAGWAALFSRVGGFTVTVPERLVERSDDGSGQTRFEAGEQYLDGPRLAELLTFRGSGEPELDALSRVPVVLTGLLETIADDPVVLDAMFGDGAPMLEVAEGFGAAELREVFAGLAEAAANDQLTVRMLPVTPLGAGDDGSYRVDRERAQSLIASHLGASVPLAAEATVGRSLEIRNGNGRPGAGQRVAQLLIPLGFRVVLTGNADRFDHRETRILIYDDDPDQLAVAEEIRAALGVGRIELSQVPQDIVDVTIVVGQDLADS